MIGQMLDGRYRVVRILGSGGFGQTFVAEDTRRPGNPICVVKHLKPASTDPQFLQVARRLFESEAETLEKLGNHDQIPRLLAFFEQDQEFYLVQDLIEGHSLASELVLGQRWSDNHVIKMLEELLGILGFIHRQGVIHRDIKPDNIIRRQSDDKLVLVDFGAVKQLRTQTIMDALPMSATVAVGTPGYMASEQSQGQPRPSSDLYALGIIGIQALTGMKPSQLRVDEDSELVWRDQAQMGEPLAAFMTKMVRHYFKLRFQSAGEALQALKHLQQSHPPFLEVKRANSVFRAHRPTSRSAVPTQAVLPQIESVFPTPESSRPFKGLQTLTGLGALVAVLAGGAIALTALGPELRWPSVLPSAVQDQGPAILAQAQEEAKTSGDLGKAILVLQDIPPNSSVYEQSQDQIRQWQTQWQQQNNLYTQAKAAYSARRWHAARDLAYRLPRNAYWDAKANLIYFQAKQKIADLEKPKPTPTPKITKPPEGVTPTPTPSISPTPKTTPLPDITPAASPTPQPQDTGIITIPVPSPSPFPTPSPPPSSEF